VELKKKVIPFAVNLKKNTKSKSPRGKGEPEIIKLKIEDPTPGN